MNEHHKHLTVIIVIYFYDTREIVIDDTACSVHMSITHKLIFTQKIQRKVKINGRVFHTRREVIPLSEVEIILIVSVSTPLSRGPF